MQTNPPSLQVPGRGLWANCCAFLERNQVSSASAAPVRLSQSLTHNPGGLYCSPRPLHSSRSRAAHAHHLSPVQLLHGIANRP